MADSAINVGDTHTPINIGGVCSTLWNAIYLGRC
jgi:hypothetical protein